MVALGSALEKPGGGERVIKIVWGVAVACLAMTQATYASAEVCWGLRNEKVIDGHVDDSQCSASEKRNISLVVEGISIHRDEFERRQNAKPGDALFLFDTEYFPVELLARCQITLHNISKAGNINFLPAVSSAAEQARIDEMAKLQGHNRCHY
jgi:hypothetical protein